MPFCDKETLEVIHRPSYKAAKGSQSTATGGMAAHETKHRMGKHLLMLYTQPYNDGIHSCCPPTRWGDHSNKS